MNVVAVQKRPDGDAAQTRGACVRRLSRVEARALMTLGECIVVVHSLSMALMRSRIMLRTWHRVA